MDGTFLLLLCFPPSCNSELNLVMTKGQKIIFFSISHLVYFFTLIDVPWSLTTLVQDWNVHVSHSVVSNSWWPHSLPGSSVPGILQARILEWVAMLFYRGSIFPTWRLNPGLLHCRQVLFCPSWIRPANAEGWRGWASGFSPRCRWRWCECLKE